jgi:hypothetical protein
MSIADIILSLITWVFQKLILPIIPTNLPLISCSAFTDILNGTLQHNLIYSFSGLAQLFNLKLLFILLSSIIFGEIIFWLIRTGFFIVKLIRG